MDKLLLGLSIPAVRQRYDFFAPQDMEIGTLIKVLVDGLVQLTDGRYVSSGREMLTVRDPDILLDPKQTLHDYGVMDGAQLVLF